MSYLDIICPQIVPKACGYTIYESSEIEGENTVKNIKNRKYLFVIFVNFKPQKWIPGLNLILLDPNNLSVRQNLPFLDLPKMANGNGNWQIWQCCIWSIFHLQTSSWGLKVSEINQEFISEE